MAWYDNNDLFSVKKGVIYGASTLLRL